MGYHKIPDAPGLRELVIGADRDDVGGFATLEVISPDGRGGHHVKARIKTHNLVVNTGKIELWRRAMGLQPNVFNQFRIGVNGTTPQSGDTNVITPVAGSLVTADLLTMVGRTAQMVVSYPSGAGSISIANIQEVAVLNDNVSPGGDALMRAVFNPVSKTLGDKLKIVYEARIA